MKKTLLHILMHNGRLLERALEEELAPHGLHHGQGRILLNIKSAGEITQADLARRMDVKPATVTNMLKPLEEKHLIERVIDEKTNRAVIVSLSPAGETACALIQAGWDHVEERMRSQLPDEGLDGLFMALESIRAALGGREPTDRKES
jgi:DNA-binding MarR family transcriptional regulator